MSRPAIEVADIVRAKGRQYLEYHQLSVSDQQPKDAYCGTPISFDSCSRILCLDAICSSLRRAS
jgi:hypothetical protein